MESALAILVSPKQPMSQTDLENHLKTILTNLNQIWMSWANLGQL